MRQWYLVGALAVFSSFLVVFIFVHREIADEACPGDTGETHTTLCLAADAVEADREIAEREDEELRDETGAAPDVDWMRQRMEDENGTIPANALIRALTQKKQLLASQSRTAAIGRNSWEELGPTNIGGRVRSLIIHPTNPSIMYAGGVRGGIWKSVDAGLSWAPLDDFLPNLGVTALAFDPIDPTILWAGTGEYVIGGGIYRSTDAGAHWTIVNGTTELTFRIVRRIVITRVASKTVVNVATAAGVFHTEDNGATWSRSLSSTFIPTLVGVNDVEAQPRSSSALVAASNYNGVGLWFSRDAGISWTLAQTDRVISGRVELAYAASTPSVVYATTQEQGNAGGLLLKSTDGGETYVTVNANTPTIQGFHNLALWVDPTDARSLLLGAVDVYRSTDGGVTFSAISDWAHEAGSTHADQHLFVAEPGFNGTTNVAVFVANDGGISRMENYRTATSSSGWESRKAMLSVTQFYGVGGNPQTGMIIGGTQDNGNLIYSMRGGSTVWLRIAGGDGGMITVNRQTPQMSVHEYVYLMNMTRRDAYTGESGYISGEYVVGASSQWKNAPYFIPDAKNKKANFIAPILYDPNSANTLYAGGATLWRTTSVNAEITQSAGPAWEAVSPEGTSMISAIAVAIGDSSVAWYGQNNGALWKSTNATAAAAAVTWSDMSAALPKRTVTDIWINPTDQQHVVVTFGGFSSDNIWVTRDAGSTWQSVAGSGVGQLPQVPIYAVTAHPTNPDWLYVGTEIGVFSTETAGAAWSTSSQGPANAPVFDMDWVGSALVLATHGRGMFAMNFALPAVSGVTVTAESTRLVRYTIVFNKPVTGVDVADFRVVTTGTARGSVTGVTGTGTTYAVDIAVPSGIGMVRVGLVPTPTIIDLMGQSLDETVPYTTPACLAARTRVTCSDVVTTTTDSGAGSLSEVVAAAAADAVIRFDPALSGTRILLQNPVLLTKNITIDAMDTNAQIGIDGGGVTSLFIVTPGVVATIQGVHLTNAVGYDGAALQNSGTLLVRNSSIAGNTARHTGAALYNTGTATIVNSTIYGNTATTGDVISNQLKSTMTLLHVTVSGNTAGIAVVYNIGTLVVKNTIIADSTGDGCYTSSFYGKMTIDRVISESGRCPATSTRDPLLALPALNGGLTYTNALKEGSIARNMANDSVCASVLVGKRDQRGMVRPVGAHCDVGAYEAGAVAPTATRVATVTRTPTPTRTRTRTRTATPRRP